MSIKVTEIKQSFPRPLIGDVARVTSAQMQRIARLIGPGKSVAIAVGSRGIVDIISVVKSVVGAVYRAGSRPFVVPAMGSHGGATAEGQVAVLASYGIDEATVGAPVVSSMDVMELDRGDLPNRVFMDRNAAEADGVIAINRIKPHTDFHGTYESGLAKMLVIGLGKHAQALEIHRHGVYGLRELIPQTARRILASSKILAGVGIVENAYDQTAHIEVIEAAHIMEREPCLLEMARNNMPRLPVEDIHILIVDRMGKDISGVGLDPNIIGRMMIRGEKEPATPQIRSIVVTDLSEKSHGNALGTGLADVITRRLLDKINFDEMYENVYTSTFLERARIPVVAQTDLRAFQFALRSCGSPQPDRLRLIRITDTLHLERLHVSPAVAEEVVGHDNIELAGEPFELFAPDGSLVPFEN